MYCLFSKINTINIIITISSSAATITKFLSRIVTPSLSSSAVFYNNIQYVVTKRNLFLLVEHTQKILKCACVSMDQQVVYDGAPSKLMEQSVGCILGYKMYVCVSVCRCFDGCKGYIIFCVADMDGSSSSIKPVSLYTYT